MTHFPGARLQLEIGTACIMGHTAPMLGNEEVLLAGGGVAYQVALKTYELY